MRFPILVLLAAISVAAHAADPGVNDDIAVHIQKHGPTIVVDVEMQVSATPADAWAVFTDYEHMADFVSNLKVSEVTSRQGNRLEVRQAGEARKGPLTFTFETVRAVELIPVHEIRSTLVRGDFKSYEFTTQIEKRGETVVIANHGEYIPTRWVPPVIGPALIESETRKQYGELRDEILRRKRAASLRSSQ